MVNFPQLRTHFHRYEEEREKLIQKSREVIRLSKQIIYAVHRDEISNAAKLLPQMEKGKKELDALAQHSRKMAAEGSYKVALQEYVEALLYYHFVRKGELVDLSVEPEPLILGMADLTGELVRRAVFLAGKGKVQEVIKIRDVIDLLYGEMLKFDFRDNEIRRKVDGIKYDLRKLEDLVLDLKLKGR